MQSVFDVANYFLFLVEPDIEDCVTNLKLQKLCYYAQGFFLAENDRRLFANDLQAWQHGPVVPELYHKYKEFGGMPLLVEQGFIEKYDTFDGGVREFLSGVYSSYGQFSAWKLRDMTHQELPWQKAVKRPDRILLDKDMVTFFKQLI